MPALVICTRRLLVFETTILRLPDTNSNRKEERIMKKVKKALLEKVLRRGMKKEAGIDGILVTVGLCIIALLLCVVMKDSMAAFIQTIVNTLTAEAQKILTGVSTVL